MPHDTESLKIIIDNIHELIASNEYAEAERLIRCIPDMESQDPILLFFKAICDYEQDRDLECLKTITHFLSRSPNHIKADYSVFTAAACLANLGMEEDAILLLNALPVSYPDVEREKRSISAIIRNKAQGRIHFEEIAKIRGGISGKKSEPPEYH